MAMAMASRRGFGRLRSVLRPSPFHLAEAPDDRLLLSHHRLHQHHHLHHHHHHLQQMQLAPKAAATGSEDRCHHRRNPHLQASRSFASASTPSSAQKAATSAAGSEAPAKKRRRSKKKNFIEVAQFLPNWGIGAKFTKSHWPDGNFYRVTNVKLYKSGRYGAAWGVFHQSEAPKTDEVQKIGGVNKRCWRYVPDRGADAGAETAWKRIVSFRPPASSSTAASESASVLDAPEASSS